MNSVIGKRISNPFTQHAEYQCFGCSPNNPVGIKLTFVEDGEWLKSSWMPSKSYEGWINVLHGGIQATLMDEIASWMVFVKLGTAGVTTRMEVMYHKPIYINGGAIEISARLKEMKRNIAVIESFIHNSEAVLCASSLIQYYVYTTEVARQRFLFPGKDAFINP